MLRACCLASCVCVQLYTKILQSHRTNKTHNRCSPEQRARGTTRHTPHILQTVPAGRQWTVPVLHRGEKGSGIRKQGSRRQPGASHSHTVVKSALEAYGTKQERVRDLLVVRMFHLHVSNRLQSVIACCHTAQVSHWPDSTHRRRLCLCSPSSGQ